MLMMLEMTEESTGNRKERGAPETPERACIWTEDGAWEEVSAWMYRLDLKLAARRAQGFPVRSRNRLELRLGPNSRLAAGPRGRRRIQRFVSSVHLFCSCYLGRPLSESRPAVL